MISFYDTYFEDECLGHCGYCDDCHSARDRAADDSYDAYRENDD